MICIDLKMILSVNIIQIFLKMLQSRTFTYILLLGIALYINVQVMLLQVSAVPQYFELVCDDEGYIEYILDFVKKSTLIPMKKQFYVQQKFCIY